MHSTTVVVGCGSLGSSFARRWRALHPEAELVCTVRSAESLAALDLSGAQVRQLDLLGPEDPAGIVAGAGSVLVSVAPGRGGAQAVWSEGVARLAPGFGPSTHVVHISSTGVYAPDLAGPVDETARTADSDRARALLAAEEAVRGSAAVSTVLRCSGLVSAERGPQNVVPRLAGTRRDDGDTWLHLVWMEDVVEAVVSALERRITGTYNLSGPPQRRRGFYDPLVAAAGLEPVRWESGPGDAGRRLVGERFAAAFDFVPRAVRPGDLVG